ncbi:hypothetical protein KKB18_07125, partial [bacterium]|nr:hypothetical protein [bacterium]
MNFVVITALIAALANFLLAMFIVVRSLFVANRRKPVNFTLSLYLLSIGIWCFGVFGLGIAPNEQIAFIWVRILNIGIIGIPIFFF